MKIDRGEVEKFIAFWTARKGAEESECEQFWDSLLVEVLGARDVKSRIRYELPVYYNDKTTKFLDAWIPETQVLIEQKSRGIDLDAPQAGHHNLAPFEQANEYDANRPRREKARWIVVSNFDEIRVHDMEADRPQLAYETIYLKDLVKDAHRLEFLVSEVESIREKEQRVSIEAGRVVGKLYGVFLEDYGEFAKDPKILRELNILCVRLVFCVYAEDAGVFAKDQFLSFLRRFDAASFHLQLRELFKVLAVKPEERSPMLASELKAFPFVGGGLFKDEIDIPVFSDKVARILLDEVSEHFDWSEISPTIFGAVFESTLNPETRRKGGMHYTSEENIHKVIDPLFLDDLKAKLAAAKAEPNLKKRAAALEAFQQELGAIKFLDPACGSGNFLTETYLSLRKLENEALETRFRGQGQLDLGDKKLIHVSINQFYGIEINDFAVTVAQTAMWIAECKMLDETNAILSKSFSPLPLTDSAKIIEGNALRMDWEENLRLNERLPEAHFDYIMGNPPFIGASMMSATQKAEAVEIFGKGKRVNSIDYVGAWYYKAAAIMKGTATRAAFVSTNSLTQGEQVAPFWGRLIADFGVEIDFAWKTFVWDSEATEKAHVHVVVVGFSINAENAPKKLCFEGQVAEGDREAMLKHPRRQKDASLPFRLASRNSTETKWLFEVDGKKVAARRINPYLIDAPIVFVEGRGQPFCDVPKMTKGCYPSDGGNLILSEDERIALLSKEPELCDCVRRYVGAKDFLNNNEVRYCLWLKGVSPARYRHSSEVARRLEAVRQMRLASTAAPTRAMAEKPYLFFSTPPLDGNYLILPEVSSERRQYIPVGFMSPEVIAANTNLVLPNASLYHFGVLTSSVHMAWMRAVAGRLEMRYRYSAAIVYNNFPWPRLEESVGEARSSAEAVAKATLPTIGVKSKIEKTAQAILDARAKYPDSSLADLYDPLTMPPELRKAHAANDAAVMEAYGFDKSLTESEIVAELFKRYAELTK